MIGALAAGFLIPKIVSYLSKTLYHEILEHKPGKKIYVGI